MAYPYEQVLEQHPEYSLLNVFFERLLAEWLDRPIFELDGEIDIPTCVPNNTKLYIDTEGEIGICEKMPDTFRVGSIYHGLNMEMVNNLAGRTASLIESRCKTCPVARLCDICPNALDLSDSEMDIYCHNQNIIQKVKLRVFCELVEKGLI